jgi:hypothetical protein
MEGRYLIRPASEGDLPFLSRWRSTSHVARWWGDATVEPEREKLQDERITMWIAEYKHRPFAFIQDYAVKDWLPHHFDYLPADSDDAATPFRTDAAVDSDLIPPVLGRSVGGISLGVFALAGQASAVDFARRMDSPESSMRWALWTRRSRMASA